jgi:hypothetical protein
LVFPKGLSKEDWATINKLILNARASGETVDLETFKDLGIPNLDEINTEEAKAQLGLTVVEETTPPVVSLNADTRVSSSNQ